MLSKSLRRSCVQKQQYRIMKEPPALIFAAACIFSCFLYEAGLWAQQAAQNSSRPSAGKSIDLSELKSKRIRFQSYKGGYASAQRKDMDRRTGQSLARQVQRKAYASHRGLSIKRVFGANDKGLGADILQINSKAQFKHINSIKRILRAYLQKLFSFSSQDAALLSSFILYYNAQNRNNIDALRSRYSSALIQALEADKLGIDIHYKNWPGQSQILIPLRKKALKQHEPDFSLEELYSGLVAPTHSLEEQKQFWDTAKRHHQKEAKELQAQASSLAEQHRALAKKRRQNAKKQKALEKLHMELQGQASTDIASMQKKQKKIAKDRQGLLEEAEEIARKQQKLKAAVAANLRAARSSQEQRQNLSLQMQNESALAFLGKPFAMQDNGQKNIGQASGLASEFLGSKLFFLRTLRKKKRGHYQNQLWYLDLAKKNTLVRGDFDQICSPHFLLIDSQGVLVSAYNVQGKKGGSFLSSGKEKNRAEHHANKHYLILLDEDNLRPIAQSKLAVYWRTPFKQKNQHIYAFVEEGKDYYLGRFSLGLALEKKSKAKINPYAEISFYKKRIYLIGKVAASRGPTSIHILREQDLSSIEKIESPRLAEYP